MFCIKCGMENIGESRFCIKCGSPLVVQEAPVNVGSERIPQYTIQSDTQQYATPQNTIQPVEPVIVKRKMPLRAIVLAAAVGAIAAALAFVVLYFVIGVQTDSKAMIEGQGYASAEDAVSAYLDALSKADLDAMISTFAIESYEKHYDLEAMIERVTVYTPGLTLNLPSDNEFTKNINIKQRQGYVVREIKSQYMTLFVPDSEALQTGTTQFDDPQDISRLLETLSNQEHVESLNTLKFVEFRSPGSLNELYDTEINQENIQKISKVIGAQKLENIVARVRIDGNMYLFCFDAACYEGRWYIHSLGGNIGNFLNLHAYSGGVILEAYLP